MVGELTDKGAFFSKVEIRMHSKLISFTFFSTEKSKM